MRKKRPPNHTGQRTGHSGKSAGPTPSLLAKVLARSTTDGTASTFTPLEVALEQFAMNGGGLGGPPIPDYSGFMQWLVQQHQADPTHGLVFNRFSPLGHGTASSAALLHQEMREMERRYRQEFETLRERPVKAQLRKLNKLKLLVSALRGDARSKEVEGALLSIPAFPSDLDEGLSICTQAQLRTRLFASLSWKEWRTAFKIVGKLKEESHDPGELAYLEALTRFHCDDLEGCIKYAAQVAPDHADHASASALWLESLAYQGSAAVLLDRLKILGTASLSPMFLAYLTQVLLLNSSDPEAAAHTLSASDEQTAWQLNDVTIVDDPFLPAFNRHSCAVALRLVEFAAGAALARDLSHADTVSTDDAHVDLEHARLLLPLMAVDPSLAKAIVEEEPAQRYRPIVTRLMNAPYEAGLDDVTQALRVQFRLGIIDPFIQNMSRMIPQLQAPWPSAIVELMRAAYVEAASRRHPALAQIAGALQSVPVARDGLTIPLEEQIERSQRLTFLSPMSRLAYAWAEEALTTADRTDAWHADAGMISLGFFRILEHELNELVIGPLRQSDSTRVEVDALWSRIGAVLSTLDESIGRKAAKKREAAYGMWTQMIERLQGIFTGERPGLELGSLHMLIEKSRSTSGEDVELKRYFASKMTTHLNETGKLAFSNGEISRFVERPAIERFRNPAAHSRFVSLASAKDCKRHVDAAVLSLKHWSDPRPLQSPAAGDA